MSGSFEFQLATSESLAVRNVDIQSLSPDDVAAWRKLLERSCEPNPFLSPDFVLALVDNLKVSDSIVMQVVLSTETGRWMAAGIFEVKALSSWWALNYAHSLTSDYTFLDGLLLDKDYGSSALTALFQSQRRRRDWHGLHFGSIRDGSEFALALDRAAHRAGIQVCCGRTWNRASFINRGPRTIDDLLACCSKSRRKSLRRGWRKLEARGTPSFRLVIPQDDASSAVDTFLRLEKMSWKGQAGTAIACHSGHEAFFRQMIAGFARSRNAIFGELLVDDEPVASTCNLRCGPMLSAFKIGRDPAYDEAGVGMWSEVQLTAAISQFHPEIVRIDSSAKLGSYLESVWSDRETMTSVTYSWSNRGAALQFARRYLHRLRSQLAEATPRDAIVPPVEALAY